MKRAQVIPPPTPPVQTTAQAAAEKIIALKWMTRTRGFQTSRSQSAILKTLNEADLADVSLALQQHFEKEGW